MVVRLVLLGLILPGSLLAQRRLSVCELDASSWLALHEKFGAVSPVLQHQLDSLPRLVDAPVPARAMDAAVAALDAGWNARVEAAVAVDTSGTIVGVEILRSIMRERGNRYRITGMSRDTALKTDRVLQRAKVQQLFEQATLDLMYAARFNPGTIAGVPQASLLCVPTSFTADQVREPWQLRVRVAGVAVATGLSATKPR